MFEDLAGIEMPCAGTDISKELRRKGWQLNMINNTMAYVDGRYLFMRFGRWDRHWSR